MNLCASTTEAHGVPTSQLLSPRAPTIEASARQGEVAPAHHNKRKPEQSSEDTAQPKINKYINIYIYIKTRDTCWQGYGDRETLVHFWLEYKLVEVLQKTL